VKNWSQSSCSKETVKSSDPDINFGSRVVKQEKKADAGINGTVTVSNNWQGKLLAHKDGADDKLLAKQLLQRNSEIK